MINLTTNKIGIIGVSSLLGTLVLSVALAATWFLSIELMTAKTVGFWTSLIGVLSPSLIGLLGAVIGYRFAVRNDQ
jgi:hypothetical protein